MGMVSLLLDSALIYPQGAQREEMLGTSPAV